MRSWPAELPPPSAPPDDARRAAEEILSRPAYREPEPSLVERALDALGDVLGEGIATLTGGGPGGVVAAVVVAVLVAASVWVLVRSVAPGLPRVSPDDERLVQGTTAPDDPSTWLTRADRHVVAGDHRAALRCRYQAMVATLLRDGVVDDVPGRTPRELAAELVALAPALEDQAGVVCRQFERAWYGGAPVTAAEYDSFAVSVATIEDLRRSIRHGRPQGAHA